MPALRGVVQAFESRVANLKESIQTTPLPAKPDQFIEIYLAEPYRVSVFGAATICQSEDCSPGQL